MDKSKFIEIEGKYNDLKLQLEQGLVDQEDMKSKLKKLMLRDEDGNYWMIGSNTGKWYIYNGKEWKEKSPYSADNDLSMTQQFSHDEDRPILNNMGNKEEEKIEMTEDYNEEESFTQQNEKIDDKNKINEINLELDSSATIIKQDDESINRLRAEHSDNSKKIDENVDSLETNEDNDEENDGKMSSCIVCQSKIPSYSVFCSFCGANQKELGSKKKKGINTMTITSIHLLSLIFFMGGLGLIFGVIFGASFGIFNIFNDFLNHFPQMLIETRGKIQGGLIFAALGGIAGFLFFSIYALLAGFIYNAISYLFGGIKIKTR